MSDTCEAGLSGGGGGGDGGGDDDYCFQTSDPRSDPPFHRARQTCIRHDPGRSSPVSPFPPSHMHNAFVRAISLIRFSISSSFLVSLFLFLFSFLHLEEGAFTGKVGSLMGLNLCSWSSDKPCEVQAVLTARCLSVLPDPLRMKKCCAPCESQRSRLRER